LPLYEAKLIHQFDHRWATYDGDPVRDLTDAEKHDQSCVPLPRYWVAEEEVDAAINQSQNWHFGVRRFGRSTDERTVILSVVPHVAIGDSATIFVFDKGVSAEKVTALYYGMCSFAFDFTARQKVGGVMINQYILEQLPVLSPNFYTPVLLNYIVPRVLELTYTAWDLQPFAHDLGYDGEPFTWDVDRRFQLRCELDALYFHLYGIARADVDYIMETFPIVKRKDLAEYGTYRTKETILAVYDELAITF